MKVNKVILCTFFTILCASLNTQCMLNSILQKVGTFVGFSLATGPLVLKGAIPGYQTRTIPEIGCIDTDAMSSTHQEFYRTTVVKNPTIQLRTSKTKNCAYNCGHIIVMPEIIDTPTGTISLSDALTQKNKDALSAFKGICEHELRHYENGDDYKEAAERIITPIITTSIAGIALKKIAPPSKTFIQHVGRCIGKIAAGTYGLHANEKITERVVLYRNRKREFAADQGVSPENRETFINALTIASNNNLHTLVKEQWPNFNKAQRKFIALKIREQIYASHTHPAPWDRAAALFPIQSKKS